MNENKEEQLSIPDTAGVEQEPRVTKDDVINSMRKENKKLYQVLGQKDDEIRRLEQAIVKLALMIQN